MIHVQPLEREHGWMDPISQLLTHLCVVVAVEQYSVAGSLSASVYVGRVAAYRSSQSSINAEYSPCTLHFHSPRESLVGKDRVHGLA